MGGGVVCFVLLHACHCQNREYFKQQTQMIAICHVLFCRSDLIYVCISVMPTLPGQ